MEYKDIKFDCKHFRGHIPCKPNKSWDVTCDQCEHYTPITKRILIIKLAAIGDVIRTTPLLKKYRSLYPDCHITWVTLYPDVLPPDEIDTILKLDGISIMTVTNASYDIAINLDKDPEACALLYQVKAQEKYGFTLDDGHIGVATPRAQHKLITGLFDGISQKNTKSYLEEIFEICHLEFDYEEYSINVNEAHRDKWQAIMKETADGKPIIGLNTGCGERWKTRMWPADYWKALIAQLTDQGYFCLLLGGKAEHEGNLAYAQETDAHYAGHYSLPEFIGLASTCDAIVTPVSLTMHIALALRKQMILFNNIFNPHEFELYGRGMIIEPTSGCDCYYGNTCKRDRCCMNDLSVDAVVSGIGLIFTNS